MRLFTGDPELLASIPNLSTNAIHLRPLQPREEPHLQVPVHHGGAS